MRRTVASGVIAGAVMVGGLWTWRSPTVTLVRLKLALDRHDLAGVESAVDFDALTGAALSGLLEDRAGESETVRLALRGKGGVRCRPLSDGALRVGPVEVTIDG